MGIQSGTEVIHLENILFASRLLQVQTHRYTHIYIYDPIHLIISRIQKLVFLTDFFGNPHKDSYNNRGESEYILYTHR